MPNLAKFTNKQCNTKISSEQKIVKLTDPDLFDYPFLYITGHGKIKLSSREVSSLKNYLNKGGFLYVDDDYGLDQSFRKLVSSMYPQKKLTELPKSHDIFHCFYDFPNGTPKIMEHDKKRPQTFALFDDYGRIIILYTYETNISDGWTDYSTHMLSTRTRELALKMGANYLFYILTK